MALHTSNHLLIIDLALNINNFDIVHEHESCTSLKRLNSDSYSDHQVVSQ